MNQNVLVLACGGTGVNIGNKLLASKTESVEGLANLDVVFIDTSRANITADIFDTGNFYHIKDNDGNHLDGSGKIRKENYQEIANHAKPILTQFKPETFNIIIHSGSGGSGATIAPTLTSLMLERGDTVVVIMVGSTTTSKEIDNTVATIKTYQTIANLRKKPVCVAYYEMDGKIGKNQVDTDIEMVVKSLCVLFSGQNHGLDSSDLKNWIDYSRVVDQAAYPPTMALLRVREGNDSNTNIKSQGKIVSVATLIPEGGNESIGPDIRVEYQAVGKMPDSISEKIGITNNALHFMMVINVFPTILKDLTDIQEKIQAERNENAISHVNIGKVVSTDLGIVFD